MARISGRRVLPSIKSRIFMTVLSHPDRKSTRLNSNHGYISYAVFCLKKKKIADENPLQSEKIIRKTSQFCGDACDSGGFCAIVTIRTALADKCSTPPIKTRAVVAAFD